MKKLVVFRRRDKGEKSNSLPEPVFDQKRAKEVKAPPAKRKFPEFKERRSYVAILQYRPGLRKHTDYQRLGFKADGGYAEAAVEAVKMAEMLSRAIAVDLAEIRKADLCRVLAVYEVTSFKDWDKETNVGGPDKHVRDVLKKVKAAKPISYVKADTVKVRG